MYTCTLCVAQKAFAYMYCTCIFTVFTQNMYFIHVYMYIEHAQYFIHEILKKIYMLLIQRFCTCMYVHVHVYLHVFFYTCTLFSFLFSVVRVPDPDEPAFNTGKSEDTTESLSIPNNLSRWREESQALDGGTSFLCVAGVRTPLLAALEKRYREQQALKKSEEEAKKLQNCEKPSQTQEVVPAPNPSDETTPSAATPRTESSSADQLRAVADILSQIDTSSGASGSSTAAASTTPSTTEPVTSEPSRVDEGSDSTPLVGVSGPDTSSQQSVSNPEPFPDLSTFDGSAESARSIISRLDPSDPMYTFLSAVAGAPMPPLPEASPNRNPSLTPPTSTTPQSPAASNQVSVIQNPRPLSDHQSRSQSQLRSHMRAHMSSLVTDVLMNRPGSQSPQSRSRSRSTQELVNQISSIVANEIGQAMSNHLATAGVSASLSTPPNPVTMAVSNVLPPPTSSPSPSDTLGPLFSSLQMPNQQHSSPPTVQQPHEDTPTHSTTSGPPSSGSAMTTSPTSTNVTTATPTTTVMPTQPSTSTMMTQSSEATPTLLSTSTMMTQSSEVTVSQSEGASSNTDSSQQVPEGIDPTFLAALPDSIRQEVVAQYEREQRQRTPTASGGGGGASSSRTALGGGEINPEVLAALPPEIQEEVITIHVHVQYIREFNRNS